MDVGVFVVDGAADFGLAAILEVLGTADSLREEIDQPPPPWTVTVLGLGSRVQTGAGHTVPTSALANISRLPDVLVVPALNIKQAPALIELVSSPRHRPVLALLRDARAARVQLAAACSGTFFLAEADVLDGCLATTSWWLAPVFRRRYPRVNLQEGHTLCRGPGITTAGAAFSHVDLALTVVQDRSPALADLVSRYLMVGYNAPQKTYAIPAAMAQHDPVMAKFELWIRSHLDQPLQISAAAHALGITERGLQRAAAATLGMTPIDFVNEIRLHHATHLLRSTNLSADAVAARVGYLTAGTLRDLVRRRRGITIRELRRGPTRAATKPDTHETDQPGLVSSDCAAPPDAMERCLRSS